MKIYEVEQNGGGETDWVLVKSIDDVIPFLKTENEDCAADGAYDDVTPKEIPESEWSEHWTTLHGVELNGEKDPTITFKEFVERESAAFGFSLPMYIAGTMFQ